MSIIAQQDTTKKRERKEHDAHLIHIMRTGTVREREKAYAELYNSYIGYIEHYFSKHVEDFNDAQDLALEAISKAFNKIDTFNKNTQGAVYAFSSWMQRIATNTLIDFKRKDNKFKKSDSFENTQDSFGFGVKETLACTELQPDEALERKDEHALLHNKLKNLKPLYQRIIKMRYIQEMTMKEIQKELDFPMGTIKANLFRAKEALSEQFA